MLPIEKDHIAQNQSYVLASSIVDARKEAGLTSGEVRAVIINTDYDLSIVGAMCKYPGEFLSNRTGCYRAFIIVNPQQLAKKYFWHDLSFDYDYRYASTKKQYISRFQGKCAFVPLWSLIPNGCVELLTAPSFKALLDAKQASLLLQLYVAMRHYYRCVVRPKLVSLRSWIINSLRRFKLA